MRMLRETSDFGRIGQGQSENLILSIWQCYLAVCHFWCPYSQPSQKPLRTSQRIESTQPPCLDLQRNSADSAVKISSTKSVVWPPRRRVPGCNKMAIKDAWRFDKSQWALKAGIASALVLATIIWYALECGPVF